MDQRKTGTTMPDLSVLVELSDFYHVTIREIIDGERKSEKMDETMKETLVSVAQYAQEEKQKQLSKMRKIISFLLLGFGCFLIISAFTVFPSESGWGSKFAILGAIVASLGAFWLLTKFRIPLAIGIFVTMIISLILIDYASVCYIKQAPRFSYQIESADTTITYRAPFYTVIRYNRDTLDEYYEIHVGNN